MCVHGRGRVHNYPHRNLESEQGDSVLKEEWGWKG